MASYYDSTTYLPTAHSPSGYHPTSSSGTYGQPPPSPRNAANYVPQQHQTGGGGGSGAAQFVGINMPTEFGMGSGGGGGTGGGGGGMSSIGSLGSMGSQSQQNLHQQWQQSPSSQQSSSHQAIGPPPPSNLTHSHTHHGHPSSSSTTSLHHHHPHRSLTGHHRNQSSGGGVPSNTYSSPPGSSGGGGKTGATGGGGGGYLNYQPTGGSASPTFLPPAGLGSAGAAASSSTTSLHHHTGHQPYSPYGQPQAMGGGQQARYSPSMSGSAGMGGGAAAAGQQQQQQQQQPSSGSYQPGAGSRGHAPSYVVSMSSPNSTLPNSGTNPNNLSAVYPPHSPASPSQIPYYSQHPRNASNTSLQQIPPGPNTPSQSIPIQGLYSNQVAASYAQQQDSQAQAQIRRSNYSPSHYSLQLPPDGGVPKSGGSPGLGGGGNSNMTGLEYLSANASSSSTALNNMSGQPNGADGGRPMSWQLSGGAAGSSSAGVHPPVSPSSGGDTYMTAMEGFNSVKQEDDGSHTSGVMGPSGIVAPKRKGLRKVKGGSDLRPVVGRPRRGANTADGTNTDWNSISPLQAVTLRLPELYNTINPNFRYELSHNPRRVLTKPSKPAGNDNYDNEDADYILYVNDVLGNQDGQRYLVLDILGQGTFGQVVKCQNISTNEVLAVKVVKNKPAYYNQSMMEVTILQLLNTQWDGSDEHHILRLKDSFIHHNHLCLVFELLSSNLYELIKQNNFRGLSTSLVRVFTQQLLDALTVLNHAKLIHCDLKPENILLKSLSSPTIKVIDFGSACHERQTVYTYIQSRFYRSPEVILSLPYSSAIDMWSLGCICVELFLGLPLFPGTSEFNQITRIVEMLGMPPQWMLETGKQTHSFFNVRLDERGRKAYSLKSLEQYSKENNVQEQPSKKYFNATTLPDIIKSYPVLRKLKPPEHEKEMNNRTAFIDFVQGLLNLNPHERWTPQQAKMHPFVSGQPLTKPFVPPPISRPSPANNAVVKQQPQPQAQPQQTPANPSPQSSSASTQRPYGGLPTTPQRTTQAYQDAASYNKHLQQQQAYATAQQQAAYRQAQQPTNPYAVPDATPSSAGYVPSTYNTSGQQMPQPNVYSAPAAPANPPPVHQNPYSSGRGRSGTINPMDAVPPQLSRLQADLSNFTGQSVTPVLRREDQRLAWERRHEAGGGNLGRRVSLNRGNPELDYLTEQAERGNWVMLPGRGQVNPNMQYQPQQPNQQGQQYYYQPQQVQVLHQNVPHQQAASSGSVQDPSVPISAPPQAYASNNRQPYIPYTAPSHSNPAVQQPVGPPAVAGNNTGYSQDGPIPFDSYDHRDGLGAMMYTPLQPAQAYPNQQQQAMQQQQGPYYASGSNPFAAPSNSQQQQPRKVSGGNGGQDWMMGQR